MKKVIISIVLFFLALPSMFAQCSMCRATIESSISDGGGIGTGFNNGILYLMVMPYILLGLGFYFWYKKSRIAQEKRLQLLKVLNRAQ